VQAGECRLENEAWTKGGRGVYQAGADSHRRLCCGRIERSRRKRDSQKDYQSKDSNETSPASLVAAAADHCRLSVAARGGAKPDAGDGLYRPLARNGGSPYRIAPIARFLMLVGRVPQ